jgi:hypothetical protein
MTSGGSEINLIHTNWSWKTGSAVEFRVRFVGFSGDISVSFCNKNEANSIFIIVRPSPKWFKGLISTNQAYRICKRAEELKNAVCESKRRTMAGLIFMEQCQHEHRQIKAALRKFSTAVLFLPLKLKPESWSAILLADAAMKSVKNLPKDRAGFPRNFHGRPDLIPAQSTLWDTKARPSSHCTFIAAECSDSHFRVSAAEQQLFNGW